MLLGCKLNRLCKWEWTSVISTQGNYCYLTEKPNLVNLIPHTYNSNDHCHLCYCNCCSQQFSPSSSSSMFSSSYCVYIGNNKLHYHTGMSWNLDTIIPNDKHQIDLLGRYHFHVMTGNGGLGSIMSTTCPCMHYWPMQYYWTFVNSYRFCKYWVTNE